MPAMAQNPCRRRAMHWTPRREEFRRLLRTEACYHPGSVFDPISARIAEDIGFEIGMFAGSVASLTVLGAPDYIVLTMSEFAARTACGETSCPEMRRAAVRVRAASRRASASRTSSAHCCGLCPRQRTNP